MDKQILSLCPKNENKCRIIIHEKRIKFKAPAIVNIENAEKAFNMKVNDLVNSYGSVMRCLGVSRPKNYRPVHDPEDENAFILYSPNEEENNDKDEECNSNHKKKKKKKKRVKVHVVLGWYFS